MPTLKSFLGKKIVVPSVIFREAPVHILVSLLRTVIITAFQPSDSAGELKLTFRIALVDLPLRILLEKCVCSSKSYQLKIFHQKDCQMTRFPIQIIELFDVPSELIR